MSFEPTGRPTPPNPPQPGHPQPPGYPQQWAHPQPAHPHHPGYPQQYGYPQQPFIAATDPRQGPVSGSTTTKWIWFALACQALSLLVVLAMPWNLYLEAVSEMVAATQPGGSYVAEQVAAAKFMQFSVWSGVISVLSLIPSAGFIIFAYLDWRDLTRIGIVRPFHWAFAFLGSLVHGIGRAVVLARRGHPSWAPLWGMIVIQAAALILGAWITVVVFEQMIRMLTAVGGS